ncbi:MarC family protein [Pseudanabaena sp. PCC 6802]|uniref:MarC family protein n=1 Tax=Pseudanabaena sp. PCC 6802 TaxID=118173 RepID=UPI00034D2D75|nr:MarC family protein [Pseudanabaena sp. PCC 6802]
MIQNLIAYAVGTLITLFPIANPLGAVPIFYSLTATDTPRYRLRLAQKTSLHVILVLAVFLLGGKVILSFFGISLGVLKIAGGLIVAHTAWEMLTARRRLTVQEHQEAIDKEDISFTPMAVPIVSGPGAIGVVIGLSTKTSQWFDIVSCLVGIVLLGVVLYLCLVLGESLIERLGETNMGALNRILGFLILAIAVQLIADGSIDVLKTSAPNLLTGLM